MPTYDYRCRHCGIAFELQFTIAERDIPVNDSCPICEKPEAIERFLSAAPGLGDPMRLGITKTPESFKDILRNIKKKVPGATMDIR